MRIPLTKQLKALASIAGTDNQSYALGSIQQGKDGTMFATDGIKMLAVKDMDFYQPSGTDSLLPAQAVLDAPLKGRMEVIDVEPSPRDFPAWRDVVPEYTDENSYQFTLDANHLLTLVKAIQKITDDKHARLTFKVRTDALGARKPIAISYANAQGYLMPITF